MKAKDYAFYNDSWRTDKNIINRIPPNADCASCPFLDIDYCNVLDRIVDSKECGVNIVTEVDFHDLRR